jgi:NAD(P)-dependent dehydrogenase (short-subunit alcohol dehydrogenase family)
MEGNFSKEDKSMKHPHTNMAKAALNMMTRTSATDYAEDLIYMNSVDVGYITNERPFPLDLKKEDREFKMPLDEIDGAARICDPIFQGVNHGKYIFGEFLKNFNPYSW